MDRLARALASLVRTPTRFAVPKPDTIRVRLSELPRVDDGVALNRSDDSPWPSVRG